MDKGIERAILAGERNKVTVALVHNWCAHAIITRTDGRGLVELETGLPIGHLGMGCPYASRAGMMSWDLRDAVVQFYDQNCASCSDRIPVSLPNISQLVEERDRAIEARLRDGEAAASQARLAREQRDARRSTLRATVGTVPSTIVDQIEELDTRHSAEAALALVKTVEIAPESFTPEIVDYLYETIASNEEWILDSALRILRILDQGTVRLAKAAIMVLSRRLNNVAGDILATTPHPFESGDAAAVFRGAVELARPRRYAMSGWDATSKPQLLLKLYRDQPHETKASIRQSLNSRIEAETHRAARAIDALASECNQFATQYARDIVALVCRIDALVDDHDEERHDDRLLDRVETCCDHLLREDPEGTVKLVRSYADSAADEGLVRLVRAYDSALSGRRTTRQPVHEDQATPVLHHLLDLAATSTQFQVLGAVSQIFRGHRTPIAITGRLFDLLLGSAAVLIERIEEIKRPAILPDTFYNNLEFENARNSLANIVEGILTWLVSSAESSTEHARSYIAFMKALPEGREALHGRMIEAASPLLDRADLMAIFLPEFYSALLGASAIMRAYAAKALERISIRARNNLPELVFEAAAALLTDRYVVVHQRAFAVVERGNFPSSYKESNRSAVADLIVTYCLPDATATPNRDAFLLDCIAYYCGTSSGALASSPFAELLIDKLLEAEPYKVAKELRDIQRGLNDNPRFVDLLSTIAQDDDAIRYEYDDIRRAFSTLPETSLKAAAERTFEAARQLSPDTQGSSLLLECLTRVGALEKAWTIAKMAHDHVPDTIRDAPERDHARLRVISIELERMVEAGDFRAIHALKSELLKIQTSMDERVARDQQEPPFPSHHFSP
ncbi:hypothetical protein [Xanthomonas sp. NCPPB 2632]|uniref:hypothetical protein n=1 Tax=Xanthomonas sp. NCPPB 2632 TaxID=3240912 RepID=UPI0035176C15